MMQDFLFCPIKDCGWKLGVEVTASAEECEEALIQFKTHLTSHTHEKVVESLYACVMWTRGEKISFRSEKRGEGNGQP